MSYQLKSIKVLGITRDFNKCDCCGKENLAKTVAILDVNYGVVMHFGVVCAAKADKFDTLNAFAEAKKEISKAVYTYSQCEKNSYQYAWGQCKRMFGINKCAPVDSFRLNCDLKTYQDLAAFYVKTYFEVESNSQIDRLEKYNARHKLLIEYLETIKPAAIAA